MKITIVGAGAMGSLFGAMLSQDGQEVLLVDKRCEQVEAINRNGITILYPDGSEERIKARAACEPVEAGDADLVILLVKSYDTEQALQDCLSVIGSHTTVLTLQNGLGNIEKISSIVGQGRVIAGTTSYGCCALGPGRIALSNRGEVTLGEIDGQLSARIQELAGLFQARGIQVQLSDNIAGVIWTKLAVNVGINAITAITSLKNGQLLAQKETQQLMELAIEELLQVARCRGITLLADPVLLARQVAQSTFSNKSSMLQDLECGRKTEIDSINGAVAAEGGKAGVETPVNQVLTLLIKILENK
jgi:2-dehydropantoate 2-reductase